MWLPHWTRWPTQRCFGGCPCSRSSSLASCLGWLSRGNGFGRRFKARGPIRPDRRPTRGSAIRIDKAWMEALYVGTAPALLPSHPDLHPVPEAQLARNLIGEPGGLCDQQSDQVVGQQIDPQLFRWPSRGSCSEAAPEWLSRGRVGHVVLCATFSGPNVCATATLSARLCPEPIRRIVGQRCAFPHRTPTRGWTATRSRPRASRTVARASVSSVPVPVRLGGFLGATALGRRR